MGILFSSGAQRTAYEVQQGHNLEGKLAIVTGSSNGIGRETARQLLHAGAKVIVTSPRLSRAQETAELLRQLERSTKGSIVPMELSLDSLRSVKQFVAEIKAMKCDIDYLILNAAIMGCPLWRTREGFEMHLGVNYIGHVHLTQLLLESMLDQKGLTRIVVVTCRSALEGASLNLADMNYKSRRYDAGGAYHSSKLALVYFAMELALRLANTRISVFLVHPGIVPTSLSRYYGPLSLLYAGLAAGWTKSVQAAAATSLYACLSRSLDGKSGEYLQDCKAGKMPGRNAGNPQLWHKVWEMTQDWIDDAELDSCDFTLNPGVKIADWFWTRYIDPMMHYMGMTRTAEGNEEKQD